MTVWRPINGFLDFYEVSNDGQVRRIASGGCSRPGRVLKGRADHKGYLRVVLHGAGTRREASVHRLVAEAYNHASNLEWASAGENVAHSHRIGLRDGISMGIRNGRAKLTDADVVAIRTSGEAGPSIALRFGVSKSLIGAVRRGEVWTHVA